MKLFRFIKLNNILEKKSGEVDEGKMKDISVDLKDLDDKAFKAKYGKDKKDVEKMLKAGTQYNQKEQKFYEDMLEEIGLVESNMDKLNDIVKKKQNANIKFKDKSAKVDLYTASAVVGVINKLKNPSTKNKAIDMVNKGTLSQFMKLQKLAFGSIKSEYQAEGTWHLPKSPKDKKALGKALKGKITNKDEKNILKLVGDDEVADIFGDAKPGEDLNKKISARVKEIEKELRKSITEDEELPEGFSNEKSVAQELKKALGKKMSKADINSYVQDNADNPHKVDQNAVADELKKIGVRVEELEIQEDFEKQVMKVLSNYGVKGEFEKGILYVEGYEGLTLAKRALDHSEILKMPYIVEKTKKEAAGGVAGVEQDDSDKDKDNKKKKNGDTVDTQPSLKVQPSVCETDAVDTDDEEGDGDDTTTDETQMTDAQMKKREEIVKGMKDKISDFKKKYGERWKDVMYATATKLAMQENYKSFKWTKKS